MTELLNNNNNIMLSRFNHIWLFVTPWNAACQALLSMGFSRQEYWRGLPSRPPGNLLNPGLNLSLTSPALAGDYLTMIYLRNATFKMICFPVNGFLGVLGGSDSKKSVCNAGDLCSIPRLGLSPGVGNSHPLQYSCLENPMDRGTWQTIGSQRVRHD